MKRLAVLLLLATAGCEHTLEYTSMNTPPRPLTARTAASVEMHMTTRPERPFIEVGYFEIEQESAFSGGTPEMLKKLRQRAARIGCDAIVVSEPIDRVKSYTSQSTGTVTTTGAPGSVGNYSGMGSVTPNSVRGHRATCLVFKDPPATGADAKPDLNPTPPATLPAPSSQPKPSSPAAVPTQL